MTNPSIQVDIAEVLKDLQSGQKEILKEISDIKVSLETVKGDIKTLDTKVEQLDKRIANQEFLISFDCVFLEPPANQITI